jgi:mono/diheme cytochrome c family protein
MRKAYVGVGLSTLLITAAVCSGFSTREASGQEQAAPSAASKALFSSRCALCHGADGHGSDMGKTLHVKDLTSKEVQSESDDELVQVISNGKNNMPPFKDSLKKEEITGLVQYLRTLK